MCLVVGIRADEGRAETAAGELIRALEGKTRNQENRQACSDPAHRETRISSVIQTT